MSYKIHDPMNYATDKEIIETIQKEKLLYADKITKINHYNMSQERAIILTDKSLYNMKKKSMKRKIDYLNILGLTLSKLTYEFVVHGMDDEYDYDFVSQDRGLIVAIIAKNYEILYGKPLIICVVEEKSLKNYVTSKKDKEKDKAFTKMDKQFAVDTHQFITEVDIAEGVVSYNQIQSEKPRKGRTNTLISKHKTIKTVTLDDFRILKVLGRGSFGKVCLVQYKKTKELYAMKSLKKDVLLDQDQVESTLLEKKILQKLEHPFLVGMMFCFQTEDRIFFVMNFVRGGELFMHLRHAKHFDEEKTRFYAAIIGTALDYLHKNGIVYRDIKPENILMDENGYLKLADFGMAKILQDDEKALSFCGTPEYLAPEIITGEGHNSAADWWSYGILVYEMLCGIPPFYCENIDKMYEYITHAELRFPKKIPTSEVARDLLRKLLVKKQEQRLGSKEGFKEIAAHPFFAGIDFDAFIKKKIEAPFKPVLKGETDLSNFDEEFTNEDISSASMIPEKNLEFIKRNQKEFEEFDK